MSGEVLVDLDHAPVALIHPRRSAVLWAIAASCWLLHEYYMWSRDGVAVQGLDAAITAFWAFMLLRSLVQVVKPMRVTLDREGLRHESWPRSRSWRWDEISDVRGKPDIVTFLGAGRRVKDPAPDIGSGGIGIAIAMREAKARWTPTRAGSA